MKQHQQFITYLQDAVEAGASTEEDDAEEEDKGKGPEEQVLSMASETDNMGTLSALEPASGEDIEDPDNDTQACLNHSATASGSEPAHHNQDRSRGVKSKKNKARSTRLTYVLVMLFRSRRRDLIKAIKLNDVESVNQLLTEARLNVDSRLDDSWDTALHMAAWLERKEIALLLLNKGANLRLRRNSNIQHCIRPQETLNGKL